MSQLAKAMRDAGHLSASDRMTMIGREAWGAHPGISAATQRRDYVRARLEDDLTYQFLLEIRATWANSVVSSALSQAQEEIGREARAQKNDRHIHVVPNDARSLQPKRHEWMSDTEALLMMRSGRKVTSPLVRVNAPGAKASAFIPVEAWRASILGKFEIDGTPIGDTRKWEATHWADARAKDVSFVRNLTAGISDNDSRKIHEIVPVDLATELWDRARAGQ